MSESGTKTIGYWEVTAIGIGGMVGGGIFAVIGLSVDLIRGVAPVAFLLSLSKHSKGRAHPKS